MLILVAVTVKTVIQSGLFGHAGKATSGYSMQEAREQLGTTLAGAMTQKYTNKDYDEDDYLTEYITTNLSGSKVAGNVVLVDGWAFEIDRDKLEIINDLGKGNPEDFKAPELTVTKGELSADNLSIPLNISAIESTNGISKIEVYKVGTTEPVETFTYSNQTTQINETFTAEENATYKVTAYSKLSTSKTIEIIEIVIPVLDIGSYVKYLPDKSGNYIISTESGISSQKSIPQEELKWQVLSMNSDGTIDLVAETPISTIVYFSGALGYNNGVYLLNDLCKSQYSNVTLGAVGRSINLEDIEKHFTDTGRTTRDDSFSFSNIQYGNTQTITGYIPYAYKKYNTNLTKEPNNIAQLESTNCYNTPTTETYSRMTESITVTQSAYTIASQSSYYDNSNFHNLIFGTNFSYWLASRFVDCESYSARFRLIFYT